jgi:uncharacterized protein YjbI with pentapeptide repeats
MVARLRSWWQRIKRLLEVAVIIFSFVILIVLIIVVIIGYLLKWGWTGLSQKTLWDWLQLLIIPVVLAAGGYLFTFTISRNERKAADQRNQTEREIAQDNQCEAALQAYIDKMSELLLHEKLRESVKEDDEVRNVARVRTLTVLPRLDPIRKASVLQFLHESGLISKRMCIIDLGGADLSGADLWEANLLGVDLSKVNLSKSNLSKANLLEANLSKANLLEANLSKANLSKANLLEANLSSTDLWEADLSEADLSKVFLWGARLWGANLNKANLFDASFVGTDLSGADLSGANLSRCTFVGTDLSGTDLSGANLSGANLSGCTFVGTDLSGANLSGAKVITEQFDTAKSLQGATMPDGSRHP